MAKYSQAQNKATQKYIRNNYDDIRVRTDKGNKERIKAHATERNESLNGFINRAISETMERDKARNSPDVIIK